MVMMSVGFWLKAILHLSGSMVIVIDHLYLRHQHGHRHHTWSSWSLLIAQGPTWLPFSCPNPGTVAQEAARQVLEPNSQYFHRIAFPFAWNTILCHIQVHFIDFDSDLLSGLLPIPSICPAVQRRSFEIATFESRFPGNLGCYRASIPRTSSTPSNFSENVKLAKSDRHQPKHSLVNISVGIKAASTHDSISNL